MKANIKLRQKWVSIFGCLMLLTAVVSSPAWAWPARQKMTGVVNINQATSAELDLLPGVGAKAAEKIIAYRKHAPFARVEDLVKVKGFGKKKFQKLKPYLSVSGPTTARLETVTESKGDVPTQQARAAPVKR